MTSVESLPEHLRRPHLRPVQPLAVAKDGKQFVALRDPAMISQQMMVIPPQVMQVLPHFRGERAIDEIAGQFNANVGQFIDLVKGLDSIGLLWGPTFTDLEEQLRSKVKQNGAFPAVASTTLGSDESACRRAIDEWLSETEDPEVEGQPIGLVAPHLDYERGWPNYAAAYHTLRDVPKPDRVVILGTNHFGLGDGVVLSEYGFDSPMGRCPADETVVPRLVEKFGRSLTIDHLDHFAEHSIELQLPWLQHRYGAVPVVAALLPDPLEAMIVDDDERVAFEPFVEHLSSVLDEVGGRTMFIASSDLSHVGPQFGEPRPVDDQRRTEVERHDREILSSFVSGDAEEFLSAMRWTKNPTRWCSVGSMAAALMLAKPQSVELLDYRQACDEQGAVLVSSAAIALL